MSTAALSCSIILLLGSGCSDTPTEVAEGPQDLGQLLLKPGKGGGGPPQSPDVPLRMTFDQSSDIHGDGFPYEHISANDLEVRLFDDPGSNVDGTLSVETEERTIFLHIESPDGIETLYDDWASVLMATRDSTPGNTRGLLSLAAGESLKTRLKISWGPYLLRYGKNCQNQVTDTASTWVTATLLQDTPRIWTVDGGQADARFCETKKVRGQQTLVTDAPARATVLMTLEDIGS